MSSQLTWRAVLVIAAVVAIVGIVGAGTMTGTLSEHSTDEHFESDAVTLTNMSIEGTGEDAVVVPAERDGDSVELNFEGNSDGEERGVLVEPQTNLTGLHIDPASNSDEEYFVIERHDTGEEVLNQSAIGDEKTVEIALLEGIEYRVFYKGDDLWAAFGDMDDQTGLETDHIEVTDGWRDGSTESSQVYSFDEITPRYAESNTLYQSEHHADDPEEAVINLTIADNASATFSVEYNDSGTWIEEDSMTVTDDGEHTITIASEADHWRVTLDAETTSFSHDWDLALTSDTLQAETHEPRIKPISPENNTQINDSSVELEVDVSDPDFEDRDGTVNVSFWTGDGELIDSQEISENATVNTTWDDLDLGENWWYASAEDEYGGYNETDQQLIRTPSEIEIRDEESLELIEGSESEVTIRFFPDDGDEVVTRTTTDGTVSVADLPAEEEFVVTASVEEYHTREIIIESIFDQHTVYLLGEDEDSVYNEFRLVDQTANFPAADTKLFIEKPINDSETVETARFETIAGDYFGSDDHFAVELRHGDRYRLIIENRDGDRRSLGTYTARSSGIKELEVGSINWPKPEDDTYAVEVNLIDDGAAIEFIYVDEDERTEDLEIVIHDRFNESDVIYEETIAEPGNVSIVVPLTESQQEQQWVVDYEAQRNPTVQGTMPIGGDFDVPVPLEHHWLQAFVIIGLTMIGAAFPGRLAGIGAVAIVGVAGAAILVGWLNVPTFAWFVSAFIALLGLYGASERGSMP